jgi:spore maturation protein SpmA
MREFVAQCTAILQTPEIRQELKRLVSPIMNAMFEDIFPYIYFVMGLLMLNMVTTLVLTAYVIRINTNRSLFDKLTPDFSAK